VLKRRTPAVRSPTAKLGNPVLSLTLMRAVRIGTTSVTQSSFATVVWGSG
jgi:hypothetical protein